MIYEMTSLRKKNRKVELYKYTSERTNSFFWEKKIVGLKFQKGCTLFVPASLREQLLSAVDLQFLGPNDESYTDGYRKCNAWRESPNCFLVFQQYIQFGLSEKCNTH